MKNALRLILWLGVFALALSPYDLRRALLMAAPQTNAPRLPDGPPSGPQVPGDPVQLHAPPPQFPPDFQENPKDPKTQRRAVDPVHAQKDAEELTALAKKVQGDVGQLSKNILPKDLDSELKQIQKLAKRLRGEITP